MKNQLDDIAQISKTGTVGYDDFITPVNVQYNVSGDFLIIFIN